MKYTARELFDILNQQDECIWIEAKGGSESSHSVMETVCAFSNEPGLNGGYILMGVAFDDSKSIPSYKVVGVNDADKFQKDFATQCASMFNLPIRPEINVENLNGKNVIIIWINEVAARQKPIYFKNDGLPSGAFRRIGSTDQRCADDDLHVFFHDAKSYDQTQEKGITLEHVDENAIKRYRTLREKVNPTAEELTLSDPKLLQALGCVNQEKPDELNLAGLLIFGTSIIHRSTYPMLRVDYIRVPGNQWVENPDDRFTTIDMRGPLLLLVYRLIDAINADLPKGFLLTDENLQAYSTGLPIKALREALVNALMHRSYREHRPTQVIRYDNRLEIINPGYSLKSDETLGQPGSETRNPLIAAVFHETNLAETKGSGIRAMRKLMQEAHLVLPTFHSSREHNEFTVRLLLHHFLDAKDIEWLNRFSGLNLNDVQKQTLVFVREVGAIDNQTYRQMADCDTLRASNELRFLKNNKLIKAKGKGKATYYVAGDALNTEPIGLNTEPTALSTEPTVHSTEPTVHSTEPTVHSTEVKEVNRDTLLNEFNKELLNKILSLKERENNGLILNWLIIEICKTRAYKLEEIASILKKGGNYISRKFINPMLKTGKLKYLHPEMKHHPEQAYLTNNKE